MNDNSSKLGLSKSSYIRQCIDCNTITQIPGCDDMLKNLHGVDIKLKSLDNNINTNELTKLKNFLNDIHKETSKISKKS